jgi:hypothetical protein
VFQKLNSAVKLIQRTAPEAPQRRYVLHRIGCSQEDDQLLREGPGWSRASGRKDRSTRRELDAWIKTLPQTRTIAMEATIFTGWIYDQLPHAEKVKVAHPLMLRAIAARPRGRTTDRRRQDRRLPALRLPAGVPHGFHRDSGPAPDAALPESCAEADGADQKPTPWSVRWNEIRCSASGWSD